MTRSPVDSRGPRPGSRRPQTSPARFVVLFLLLLGVSEGLLFLAMDSAAFEHYLELLARGAAFLLRVAGYPVERASRSIFLGECSVQVTPGCDPSQLLLMVGAGILAVRARWTAKLVGIVVAWSVLSAVNLLRIAALFLARLHWPEGFELLHFGLLPVLLLAVTLALWLAWLRRVDPAREATS